ncbi:aminotransferase class I/II-fold pyridoxal phosphate-dependent enzyme [Nocardia cyriacigeorgica]|uniref:type I polyketide synthase n=3 Tax=Nocardia cyriacigeorgica TaxID=135487 RepID=UPI0018948DAD|nr:type I polyketide synthase [Nocardia cyriacigeorgica]MBF6157404.1 aminotransferase class I/II-fold pyridoxal phosphate-dependent enzyme [Nocardia cyriacigeorgica]MBF6196375.1 aminotransferase class I/II-fold pyridoxal phosphate-dependent enzyme [Nocardia cyriacigeorgica]
MMGAPTGTETSRERADIAIVGIDCRFPGADDPAALWRLLLDSGEAISEVPADRWAAEDYHDPAGGPGTVNNRRGGFLSDADAFDHEFFGITPREAAAMDPQQRLLLHTAWRALEDATLDPRAQAGTRTGVYVGVMANEWANVQMSDYAAITAQHGSGNGYFMTANRLSYQLDLRGPSMAVDTACSSSLSAIHLACTALATGECDQALAGGVNLVLTPAVGIFYTQAGLSAPDARCKPFSGAADGIVRGEGAAVLVLRRLADAQAAGLPIYAVITGSAVNSDGRSNGITAPNRWAQQQVVEQAYARAGVRAQQVDFIEAHGTGTVLGDMIEVKALGALHAGRTRPCGIGSVKGNLGHTEGAAGIAGVIKAALALHHRLVPPTRFADTENPKLRLAQHGLRLLGEAMPLGEQAVGGVSSFGVGGSNAHIVLGSAPRVSADAPMSSADSVAGARRPGLPHDEVSADGGGPASSVENAEKPTRDLRAHHLGSRAGNGARAAAHGSSGAVDGPHGAADRGQTSSTNHAQGAHRHRPRRGDPGDVAGGSARVLTLSSDNAEGLRRNALCMADALAAMPGERFAQLCWTSNQVKASGRRRLAVVASDRHEAMKQLRSGPESGVAGALSVGWMFSGQGAQYAGMARALAVASPGFRRALMLVDEAMSVHLGQSVRELLLDDTADIDSTERAQPAIFAMEYAMASALAETGLRPAWLLGHSIGEYAAAVVAGVLDLDDGCRLVVLRGALMGRLPGGGAMLAVRAGATAVADLLAEEPEVAIAAVNGPADLVLSGDAAAIARIDKVLAERTVITKALTVSHAFHSPRVEPMLVEFAAAARTCTYGAPNLPIYSTVRGRLLEPGETMDAAYWTEHIRATVRFGQAVDAALGTEPSHLIEVGPRRVLTSLIGRIRPEYAGRCLSPSPGPGATGTEFADTIAVLYRDGFDPDWDRLYEPEQRVRRRLPVYEFSSEHRFWFEPPAGQQQRSPLGTASAAPREQQTTATPAQPESPARTASPEDSEDTTIMDQMIALFREQNVLLAKLAHGAGDLQRTKAAGHGVAAAGDAGLGYSGTSAGAAGTTAVDATVPVGSAPAHVEVIGTRPIDPASAAGVGAGASAGLACVDAATTATTSAGGREAATIVYAEAARVSGYPAERLTAAQTLTGDLGFDSIMTADLFTGIVRRMPGLVIDPARFGEQATLGDVVGYVAEGGAASASGGGAGRADADQRMDPGTAAPASDAAPQAFTATPNAELTAPTPEPRAAVSADRGDRFGGQPAGRGTMAPAQPLVAPEFRISEFAEVKAIEGRIAGAQALGLANPYFLVNDGVTRDTSVIDGVPVLNFSSFNYLGLSGHPAVVEAVQDAVARYGSSCSASRVLSGEKPVHRELEAELAALLGTEDAMALVGGHSTNVTIIGHIVGPQDLVIHDSLAHDSILQGCKLSGATRRPFPHNDHAVLDRLLGELRHRYRRVLILIEGVYSQDGDIPDLPAIIEIKNKHQALLMIDEAHSVGVLGAGGGGIGEYYGVDRGEVELWSGTMSKALAGCGGYVAGSAELIRFLKYTTPGFVYSVGMTPMNAAASAAAIRVLRTDPEPLARLRRNAELFLTLAKAAGIDTGDSHDTPIIPCIVGDSLKALRLSNALLRRGINVNPILYPAVPEDLARLRFFVTACHSEQQIREAVAILAEELALL